MKKKRMGNGDDNLQNSKIEIRQSQENSGIVTEIFVDGHKLEGVRRFQLRQEVGNSVPVLTVDLNALNLSVDVNAVLRQAGFGEMEIKFKEPSN